MGTQFLIQALKTLAPLRSLLRLALLRRTALRILCLTTRKFFFAWSTFPIVGALPDMAAISSQWFVAMNAESPLLSWN